MGTPRNIRCVNVHDLINIVEEERECFHDGTGRSKNEQNFKENKLGTAPTMTHSSFRTI